MKYSNVRTIDCRRVVKVAVFRFPTHDYKYFNKMSEDIDLKAVP